MPPGAHYSRSAAFVCHWHTGCNKRFSSKRQLHRHLEVDHGLQRDAERGWRASGQGARARRRETRHGSALSRWRDRCASSLATQNHDTAFKRLPESSPAVPGCASGVPVSSPSSPPLRVEARPRDREPAMAVAPRRASSLATPSHDIAFQRLSESSPSLPASASGVSVPSSSSASSRVETRSCEREPARVVAPQRSSQVRFSLPALVLESHPSHGSPGLSSARLSPSSLSLLASPHQSPSCSAGFSPMSGAQPLVETGRQAATEPSPAGLPAARPPLLASSAAMPPSQSGGSLATAGMPPDTAEKPPASSADRPPLTTCDEGTRAVAFGVSPGPVPNRPPAGPCGDIDDDLWVPSPHRRNVWTRNSGLDAAGVDL
mmetsp:Transcript_47262/g.94174  ORF Transcript_47262/g.94174 Transcript_47262/m.94174 type:complete len:375 (+) Transcript_47262:2143-3267(+)